MPKRRNNRPKNGFSSSLRARSGVKVVTYQDTVVAAITLSNTVSNFTFTSDQLMPGLRSVGAATGNHRIFVPRTIFVEVVPTDADPLPGVLQLQIPASWGGNRTSEAFGVQPFKLTSLVNPTLYQLSYKAAGRWIPYILRPSSMLDAEELLTIQGRVEGGAVNRSFQIRITTVVDLMPQDGIVNVVPTIRTRFVSPIEQDNEEDYAMSQ